MVGRLNKGRRKGGEEGEGESSNSLLHGVRWAGQLSGDGGGGGRKRLALAAVLSWRVPLRRAAVAVWCSVVVRLVGEVVPLRVPSRSGRGLFKATLWPSAEGRGVLPWAPALLLARFPSTWSACPRGR